MPAQACVCPSQMALGSRQRPALGWQWWGGPARRGPPHGGRQPPDRMLQRKGHPKAMANKAITAAWAWPWWQLGWATAVGWGVLLGGTGPEQEPRSSSSVYEGGQVVQLSGDPPRQV